MIYNENIYYLVQLENKFPNLQFYLNFAFGQYLKLNSINYKFYCTSLYSDAPADFHCTTRSKNKYINNFSLDTEIPRGDFLCL